MFCCYARKNLKLTDVIEDSKLLIKMEDKMIDEISEFAYNFARDFHIDRETLKNNAEFVNAILEIMKPYPDKIFSEELRYRYLDGLLTGTFMQLLITEEESERVLEDARVKIAQIKNREGDEIQKRIAYLERQFENEKFLTKLQKGELEPKLYSCCEN